MKMNAGFQPKDLTFLKPVSFQMAYKKPNQRPFFAK